MKQQPHERIAHGILGGLAAGVVVALWFLVVDSMRGEPFHTPAVLAGAFAHQPVTVPTVRLVAVYSLLHFAVFACLGIAAAWLMAALHTAPRLLLGLLFGIVVQELVFYGGLLLTGVRLSVVVPWHHVIGANILSGFVLMAYLHRATREDRPFGLAGLKAHPLLTRGLVTGLIGAATVMLWFLVLDVIAGNAFRTPAALGSALLFGASNVTELPLDLGIVAAYTIVHLAAFALAGTVFVALAEQIERTPDMLLLIALAAIVLEALVVAVLALAAQWVLGVLGVASVLVANLLTVFAMGWHVWRTHPTLRHQLGDRTRAVRI
ncbi:MAG: hypothetical protein ACREMF_10875 [Gemmatimonadales bacterium]